MQPSSNVQNQQKRTVDSNDKPWIWSSMKKNSNYGQHIQGAKKKKEK